MKLLGVVLENPRSGRIFEYDTLRFLHKNRMGSPDRKISSCLLTLRRSFYSLEF